MHVLLNYDSLWCVEMLRTWMQGIFVGIIERLFQAACSMDLKFLDSWSSTKGRIKIHYEILGGLLQIIQWYAYRR